jgi:serine/threonine protein kinase/tetratricopeptide (TPR) repeat protein
MNESQACPECGAGLPANAPGGLCPRCLMGVGLDVSRATTAYRNSGVGDAERATGPWTGRAKVVRPADTIGLDQFKRTVLELGLIAPEELDRFAAGDGAGLARLMVRAGKLTPYQASAVLQGKGRGLAVGHYFVLDRLGAGGMGIVFKARDRRSGRIVALKLLPPSFGRDAEAVLRFRREFEVAARLDHPNVVSAIDAAEDRGVQFLTMEYIKGHDLDAMVVDVGPLPLKLALHCVIQAAKGLEAAHARGIIHRDIKPGNLILDDSGQVKVLDLGLARVIEAANPFGATGIAPLTQTGSYMGTVDFIAPEQADDSKRADHRADIYSLGCTLYFLLTGRPPFEEESTLKRLIAHQNRPAPSLKARRPEVPAALESTYLAMMAKRPDDRPQSMAEIVAMLEACRSSPDEAREARATLKSFNDRPLKRASPRPRGRDRDASIFARKTEAEGPSWDPDLGLEDLVMDYREEVHSGPLTEEQLPPKRSRIVPRRHKPHPRFPAGAVMAAVVVLGLATLGYRLIVRSRSKPVETSVVVKPATPKDIASGVDDPLKVGRDLYDAKEFDGAAAEFRRVIKLQPDNAEAHFYLGRYYHTKLKYDEALASYREALRLKLDDPSRVHVGIGRVLKKQGKADGAAVAFREAIRLKPNDGDFHGELSGVLQDRRDFEASLAELREAIRLKPDEAPFRADLVRLLIVWGKNAEAEAEARRSIGRFPEFALLHYNLGLMLRNQNRRDEAIAAFREGNRLDAKVNIVGLAGYYLVDDLNQAGRHDEAIAASLEMVRLKPDRSRVHQKLAESFRSKGTVDRAIEEYRRAIALDPGSLSCCRELGNLLAREGRWADALGFLARAVELAPSDRLLALQTGTLYLQLGDEAGYRRHALAVLDRFAEKPQASGVITKCCLMSDHPVEVDRAFQIADLAFRREVAANPGTIDHGWCQLDMALAEYRRGRHTRAADLLAKCRRASTGIFKVQVEMLLALAYLGMGRKAQAGPLLSAGSKALQTAGIKGFDGGDSWHDWLTCDLFRREAEALIRDAEIGPTQDKASKPADFGAAPPKK